jgi:hypothetical protein
MNSESNNLLKQIENTLVNFIEEKNLKTKKISISEVELYTSLYKDFIGKRFLYFIKQFKGINFYLKNQESFTLEFNKRFFLIDLNFKELITLDSEEFIIENKIIIEDFNQKFYFDSIEEKNLEKSYLHEHLTTKLNFRGEVEKTNELRNKEIQYSLWDSQKNITFALYDSDLKLDSAASKPIKNERDLEKKETVLDFYDNLHLSLIHISEPTRR